MQARQGRSTVQDICFVEVFPMACVESRRWAPPQRCRADAPRVVRPNSPQGAQSQANRAASYAVGTLLLVICVFVCTITHKRDRTYVRGGSVVGATCFGLVAITLTVNLYVWGGVGTVGCPQDIHISPRGLICLGTGICSCFLRKANCF